MFPGGIEMLVVVVLIILLFGAKRIPALMRSVGQSVTEFKRGISDSTDTDDNSASNDIP
ncbi:MAG: twin-arginine translocase TatA/TatE family subunit [Planctomycetota bacterium]|nr:twin-arginine translocase TatA/TatE family subunit [Planctomycetota bacterium]